MSKLIIIAGIKRSGSTWMYNAVRLCLEHAGYSVHIAGDGQYYQEDCKADYQIIKVHPFHQWMAEIADFVFTSDRDDEGIKESWQKFSGMSLTDELQAEWRNWLDCWNEYSNYRLKFESLSNQYGKDYAISCIYTILVSVPHKVEVLSKLNAINPPTDKDYDPVTLLFSNHITSK